MDDLNVGADGSKTERVSKQNWFVRPGLQETFFILIWIGLVSALSFGIGEFLPAESLHRRWTLTAGLTVMFLPLTLFFVNSLGGRLLKARKSSLRIFAMGLWLLVLGAAVMSISIAFNPEYEDVYGVFSQRVIGPMTQWLYYIPLLLLALVGVLAVVNFFRRSSKRGSSSSGLLFFGWLSVLGVAFFLAWITFGSFREVVRGVGQTISSTIGGIDILPDVNLSGIFSYPSAEWTAEPVPNSTDAFPLPPSD